MKEPGIQRPEGINGKAARYADNEVFFSDKFVRVRRTLPKKKIVALFDVVENFGFIDGLFLAYIGVFVTTPAKHVFIFVDVQNTDRAVIVAGFTFKFLFINNFRGQNLVYIVRRFGDKAVG